MTKGEIYLALSKIGTISEICRRYHDRELSEPEADKILPFAQEAKEAVEIVAKYALDNYNSTNKEERELSEVIGRFLKYDWPLYVLGDDVPYIDNLLCSISNAMEGTFNFLPDPKTEEEQTMLSQSNKDAQLEEKLKEAQKRISELENQLNDSQQKDKEEIERLKTANAQLSEKAATLDEWYTGEYDNMPKGVEFTLRERVVFFATVLSLDFNKKYTVLANLATFIEALCNDQHSVAPFITKMKRDSEVAANAKAANKVAGLLKAIIPDEYKQDEKLTINKIIESMKANFPEKEE